MPLKLKNVFYFPYLYKIGGVETWLYELGLKYGKDYDLTFLYRTADPNMREHLSEVARVIKYHHGEKIECDVFFFGFIDDILDNVEAKEYIQVLHADFVAAKLAPTRSPKVTKIFGVSDNTTIGTLEHFPWVKHCETLYNPYMVKPVRKVLRLISATRMKSEAMYDRMITFADALTAAGIPFIWTVYTDKPKPFSNPNVICLPTRLDILDYIADADYLVQLTDTEGYSYTIVEALAVGTPVITTAIPVAEEQGVINGKTGFVLPFNMSWIPVEDIYKGINMDPVKPREDKYSDLFVPGEAEYTPSPDDILTVRCIKMYQDLELGELVTVNQLFDTTRKRAEFLEGRELVKIEG